MLNFNHSIPTQIFFGKDQIQVLGKEIKNMVQIWELSGIESNPRIESVREGIKIWR